MITESAPVGHRALRLAAGSPLREPPWRMMAGMLLLVIMMLAWSPAARAADDDLPGRVGRVAELAGELFLAPQDAPDAWSPIGLNYPVAGGDNLWVGVDGRAEIDFGAGQLRLGGNTNLHLSRLDDRQFALFVAQGLVSVRLRFLDPGETARIDTPNAQVVLTRPGLYRFEVSEDRQFTQVVVREGEANVQTAAALQQVLPGQSAAIEGADPRFADVRSGIGTDGFDTWVANRDRRYDRAQSGAYVSPQMVGAADLDAYGTWAQVPQYGAVWYPRDVASDWAPYRNGYWAEVGSWGPTWVDYAPWGYAPFHYGRWAYIGGRWGWCPGAYVARPLWAPALVGWTGGPGWGISITAGVPVYGWVPLAWGEPYRPWWNRCSQGCWERYNRPYAVNVQVRPAAPPPRYVNASMPGGVSAMSGTAFASRRPVQGNLVVVPTAQAASAPVLVDAPRVRTEPGRIPVRRVGEGAPPPASTFYRSDSRTVNLPGGATAVAVPPPSRAGSSAPGGVSRMQPSTAPSGRASTATPPSAPSRATTDPGRQRQSLSSPSATPPSSYGGVQAPTSPPGGARAVTPRDSGVRAGSATPSSPQAVTPPGGSRFVAPAAGVTPRPESAAAQPSQNMQRQGARSQAGVPAMAAPAPAPAARSAAAPQVSPQAPAQPAVPGGVRAPTPQPAPAAKPAKPARTDTPAPPAEARPSTENMTRTR